MPSRSYIKPNSHTQKAARRKAKIIGSVVDVLGISSDQWFNMMFEAGCIFLELHIEDEAIIREVAQNARWGFWALWLTEFIEDDENLLVVTDRRYLKANYWELKMELVIHAKINGEHLIISNKTEAI